MENRISLRFPPALECDILRPMADAGASADKKREELQAFIKARALKVAPWARDAGISEGTVRNFLKGVSNTLTQDTVEKLAKAAGVTPAAIFPSLGAAKPQGDAKPVDHSQQSVEVETTTPLHLSREMVLTETRDLPILGHAKGGSDAYFIDNGEVSGYTMRPTSLKGVKDAYAIEIWDRSMEPALRHGRIASVNPRMRIQPEDEVVIQLYDGQALVKEYVKKTEKEWVFKQHNPPDTLRIPVNKVKAVHLIVVANRVRST